MEGVPELSAVFGDVAAYKARIDHFSALHVSMTSERKRFASATHQLQVALGPQPTTPKRKRHRRKRAVCPANHIAEGVAIASKSHKRFRMLGVQFERSFHQIQSLHQLGESTGLTPDYRGRVLPAHRFSGPNPRYLPRYPCSGRSDAHRDKLSRHETVGRKATSEFFASRIAAVGRDTVWPIMMSLQRFLPGVLSISIALVAACGEDDPDDPADAAPGAPDAMQQDQPDAMPLSQSCMDAQDHSDLAWIQDNILTPGCAGFDSCHKGAAAQAGGLNLESGQSEAALVGIDSVRFTDWKLVVAGDPDNSYLMVLLTGEGGPLADEVGTMPYNNPKLCDPKIDAIRRWITGL